MITRLVFFLSGLACLAAFSLLPHAPKVFYGLGWLGLLFAYFLWLIQTYKNCNFTAKPTAKDQNAATS